MNFLIIYILIILFIGLIKKVNLHKSFIEGVEEAFINIKPLLINIFTILFAINVFLSSGITNKIFSLFNVDENTSLLFLQCFLKPISWSSSLLVMDKIIEINGVDSKLGILSSLIQSSCDTAIYVCAFYFSFVKNVKNKGIILTAILANILTFVFCLVLTRIF